MAATKKAGLLVKKKRWLPVHAPKSFGEQMIGESYAAEPQETIGRKLLVSLSTLSGDPSKQAINIKFQITGNEGDKLSTGILGIEWLPAAVRKLVRRGREKMDESFTAITSEGKKIRIKLLMLARNKTTRGVTAQLRRLARQYVSRTCIKQSYEDVVVDIVQHKLQRGIQDALKKVYPIAISEVRQMHVLGNATQAEIDAVKATLPVEKPQKQEPPAEKPVEAEKQEQAPEQEAPAAEQAPPAESAPEPSPENSEEPAAQ